MQESPDLLDHSEIIKINRRQLLPWWIKIFCWIFMIFGLLAIGCLVSALFGLTPVLAFYGFETNDPLSFTGLLIIAVAAFKAVTAFSLWFEKDYAITLGKIDALVGILLCLVSMAVLPFFIEGFHMTIRLELALLIPYFIKLSKIQANWKLHLQTTTHPNPKKKFIQK